VILGKFRVTAVSGATATSAGNVTVEYSIQPSSGAAFGPVQTRTLNVAAGPVYLDLSAGPVSATCAWDLHCRGYDIKVNGGVSGTGGVSALLDDSTPFASITAAYASTAPSVAYRADSFGGVFATSPWYRYNITGTDNQIWPNFNVLSRQARRHGLQGPDHGLLQHGRRTPADHHSLFESVVNRSAVVAALVAALGAPLGRSRPRHSPSGRRPERIRDRSSALQWSSIRGRRAFVARMTRARGPPRAHRARIACASRRSVTTNAIP
jgi:hypothetical protein